MMQAKAAAAGSLIDCIIKVISYFSEGACSRAVRDACGSHAQKSAMGYRINSISLGRHALVKNGSSGP